MRIFTTGTYRLIAGILVTWMLLILAASATPQNQENPEVTRLLADAREKAAVLSRDADEMESLTRSEASWESHAAMLETMKEDVNDLAKTTEKLNAMRGSASPWQQQAIDRMMPLLRELASNTTAAINHLKEQKERPTSPSYAEYLRQNSETARELSDMVASFVRYGETRAELEKLEQKLEIGSGKRASR
ncbi:MAG: hypothetical protein ACRD3Q_21875 [Terriglobales bacterium]